MKPVKLIALLMFAAIILVSSPHVSVFGLGIGSGTVNALLEPDGKPVYPSSSPPVGASCTSTLGGKYRCAWDGSQFTIVKCSSSFKWLKSSPEFSFGSDGYNDCLNACKNPSTVGTTLWTSVSCVEPYNTMTKSPKGNIKPTFQTTVTSTLNYPTTLVDEIRTHKIVVQITDSSGNGIPQDPKNCVGLKTCTYINTFSGFQDGTKVQYWSEIDLSDGTKIRNPQTDSYSFTLSSSASTGGTLTPNPASINCAAGETKTSKMSGGTGAYTAASDNEKIAKFSGASGDTVSILCVASGETDIHVSDQSSKKGTIHVKVTSTSSPGGGSTADNGCMASYGSSAYCALPADVPYGGVVDINLCTNDGLCVYKYNTNCNTCTVDEGGVWCYKSDGSAYCSITGSCYGSGYSTARPGQCSSTSTSGSGGLLNIQPSYQMVSVGSTVTFTATLSTGVTITDAAFDDSSIAALQSINSNSKSITVRGTAAGTTIMTVTDSSGKTGTATVNVVASSQGSGTNGRCCVIDNAGQFSYRPDITSQTECENQGGRYYPFTCTDARVTTPTCQTYCGMRNLGTGTCRYPGATGSQNGDTGPCGGTNVCVCGSSNQNQQYQVECSQACTTGYGYGSSYGYGGYGGYTPYYSTQQATSFPIGECTNDPNGFILSWSIAQGATATGGQYVQRPHTLPGQPGSYQCQSDEYCVCTYVNFNAFTANTNRPTTPIAPGTKVWDDPADISSRAPKAEPNDHICDATASNATIKATLNLGTGTSSNTNLKLIQAGDTVTITGSVVKLANQCKGYNYTCRQEKVVGCKIQSDGWTWLSLGVSKSRDFLDCPKGLPEHVYEDGDGRSNNKRLLAAWIATAVTLGAAGPAAAAAAAKVGVTTTTASLSVVGSAIDGMNCNTNPNVGTALAQQAIALTQSGQSSGEGYYKCTLFGGYCDWFNSLSDCRQKCVGGSCSSVNAATCDRINSGSGGNNGQNNGVPCSAYTSQGECQLVLDCEWQNNQCVQTGSHSGNQQNNGDTNTCVSCIGSGGDWCLSSDGNNYCDFNHECDRTSVSDIGACAGLVTAKPTFDVTGDATGIGVGVTGNALPVRTTVPPYSSLPGTAASGSRINPRLGAYFYSSAIGQIPACPTKEELEGCFRVCGKTYNAKVAAAPTCIGVVLDAKEAAYTCGQGPCGGYADKKVRIQIKDPNGATVIDDTTTTDANGEFSYTFNAPAADGEFVAIISVPKG